MQPYLTLIALCWLVFIVVWFVFAFNTKRYVRRSGLMFNSAWWSWRFLVLVIVVLLSRVSAVRVFFLSLNGLALSPAWATFGVILCAAGIAFAIWARVHIGRNWGMPMSLKESPELVTSGPYAYVRHPIYTGVIAGMIGSAIVSPFWIIPAVFGALFFIYSGKKEEKVMRAEFPDTYPAYMQRTKMLVPFIF